MPNARPRPVYETEPTLPLAAPNWITLDGATKRYARRAQRRSEIVDALTLIGLIAIALAWVLA